METKKSVGKRNNQGNAAPNFSSNMQEMALAAQMGFGGYLDPALLPAMGANALPPGIDPQQLLAGMGGLPMMDPSIFASLNGLPGNSFPPGLQGNMASASGAEWLAMMQQAQLIAAMGGAVHPAFLPQVGKTNSFLNFSDLGSSGASTSRQAVGSSKKHSSSSHGSKVSSSGSQALKSQSPLIGNHPSSYHTANRSSPKLNTPSRSRKSKKQSSPGISASDAVSKVRSNQYETLTQNQAQTEQMVQAEMLRQFEQHFFLQQMQLQQQQDQIQAAIQALSKKPPNSNSKSISLQSQKGSQSDKIQQQLSQSIYCHLLDPSSSSVPSSTAGGFPNMSSSPDQSAIDAILALTQLSAQNQTHGKSPRASDGKNQASSLGSLKHQGQVSLSTQKATNSIPSLSDMFSAGNKSTDALFDFYSKMQPKQTTNSNEGQSNTLSLPSGFQNKQQKSNSENRSRRKQANPTSVANTVKHESLASQNRDTFSENCRMEKSSTGQTSPLSLVKSKQDVHSVSTSEKSNYPVKLSKEMPKRPNSAATRPASHAKSIGFEKAHSSKSATPKPSSSEKNNFSAVLHSMAAASPSGSQRPVEDLRVMMAAYAEMLSQATPGTKPGDLNAMNEILAATVAAEMHRLQMEQMNLSHELDLLNNGSQLSKKTSAGHGNRVPVIHKAQGNFVNSAPSKDSSADGRFRTDAKRQSSTERDAAIGISDQHQNSIKSNRRRSQAKSNNESDLKEPLQHGWVRKVGFKRHSADSKQISCDVTYVSPDGKDVTSVEEILQILEADSENKFSAKHFSFRPTLRIGSFYELIDENGDQQWKKLSPPDAEKFFESVEVETSEHQENDPEACSSDFEGRMERKYLNDSSTPPAGHEMTLEERCLLQAGEKAYAEAAKMKMEQKNEQRQVGKLLRKQQRQQRLNQQKLQREMRDQQMLQERQKLEAARQLKYQDALKKAKEREMQRQQALVDRQQERELRRQHLLFLKNLENKRRAEERDRRREEIRNERIFIRERKLEQRRHAMRLARELKMPVEDMCIKNQRPLPKLENLQGTIIPKGEESNGRWSQLSGNATADLLMVLEFMFTFNDVISIDKSAIPTIEQLQRALLNDPEHTGSLIRLTMALLHQCLCDPGVPAPGPWLHCATGLKVTDIDVTRSNYSEILRLFLWARNGHKTQVTDSLETEPFASLSSDVKAEVLAFLVNELVCSQPVCAEIDRHLENLATLRRDKWIVEGRIRQVRVEHANDGSDASSSSPIKSRNKMRQPIKDENEEKEESKEEKDSAKIDEDSNLSSNEAKGKVETVLEQKMKKLTKEHQSFNEKLFASSKPLRALGVGQDRYKRKYWVLSNLGGIYVEGLESGGWYDDELLTDEEEAESGSADAKKQEEEKVKQERDAEQSEKASSNDDPSVKMEIPESEEEAKPIVKPNDAEETDDVTSCTRQDDNKQSALVIPCPDPTPTTEDVNAMEIDPANKVEPERVTTEAIAVKTEEGKSPEDVAPSSALPASDPNVTSSSSLSSVNVLSPDESKTTHSDEMEDSVVAAAKAIAAKAVASSSHILFPNQSKTTKPQIDQPKPDVTSVDDSQADTTREQQSTRTDIKSTSGAENSSHEIGNLTAKALQSIGLDPLNLNPTQLEALARSSLAPGDNLEQHEKSKASDTSKSSASTDGVTTISDHTEASNTTVTSSFCNPEPKTTPSTLNLQNSPIDLSRPMPQKPLDQTAPPGQIVGFHPAQAALAFGGIPPGVFDGGMFYKGDPVWNSFKQEFGVIDFDAEMKRKKQDTYDEPLPIPRESKYGWWKVSEEKDLDSLIESLHGRGAREKHLSRSLVKHRKYCLEAMEVAKGPDFRLANGVCKPITAANSTELSKDPSSDSEPHLKQKECENDGKAARKSGRGEIAGLRSDFPVEPCLESSSDTAFRIELDVLKKVEELSDRCVAAGILNKAWHDLPKASLRKDIAHLPYCAKSDPSVKHDWSNPIEHDPRSVIGASVELVRKLEQAISRCYLKPPLIRKGGATEFSNLPSLSDSGLNDVAAGLRTWRNAVSSASSAAQLSMCLNMLESCIAWERTPISTRSESSPRPKKRRPQSSKSASATTSSGSAPKKKKSRLSDHALSDPLPSDENSHGSISRMPIDNADLLKGDKTREEIENGCPYNPPRGDYVTGDDVNGGYANDETYGEDVGPQMIRAPADGETCPEKKKKKKSKKKNKEKGEKPKRKKSHTVFCREMLRELQSHEMANWFLFPVDLNEVPDYKTIIKKPIDFQTIENRLRKGRYKTHEMFSAEVRAVFDNCQIFNEDESAIGRAGHAVRQFFESRWVEILKANEEKEEPESTVPGDP